MRAMLFGDEPALAPEATTPPVETFSSRAADEVEISESVETASEEAAPQAEAAAAPADEALWSSTYDSESGIVQDFGAGVETPVETPLETPVEASPEIPPESWSEAPPAETPLEPESQSVWQTEPQVATPESIGPEGSAEGSSGNGTLVIIEDDEQVGQYYATLLSGNGYTVEVATDGVSGVDLCTRLQPQVILLDVMMPRQNGILVLQTLRASDETRDTPVVVLSNFSEPTLIKRALQLGALEYVIKTQIEGAALLQAIPRWMKHEKAFAG